LTKTEKSVILSLSTEKPVDNTGKASETDKRKGDDQRTRKNLATLCIASKATKGE